MSYNNNGNVYLFPLSASVFLHVIVFAGLFQLGFANNLTQPQVIMKSGFASVELTMIPSIASKASTKSAEIKTTQAQQEQTAQNLTKTESGNKNIEELFKIQSVEMERNISKINSAINIKSEPKKKAEHTACANKKKSADTIQKNAKAHKKVKHGKNEKISGQSSINSVNSVESNGDMSAKGALTESTAQSWLYPKYPLSSRRNGEEGTVKIKAVINTAGEAVKVEVCESSGYPKLDKSAVEAVKEAKFIPARKNGAVLESSINLNIRFCLKNL